MAEHNEIGKIGEEITRKFLHSCNFILIECNYRTRFGEIDIIAKKDNKLHFIEVKSVKVKNFDTLDKLTIKPEDNLTFAKWSKLIITIEQYLKHKNVSHETRFQIDLACVYVNTETRQGLVKLLENVHKEKL
ncbi:MAG: YraN family protein [Candidatus Pacebacteria bacterium]|nr:YraN family protein [Candidatus Paceibacterota bacterium]MBP9867003.1 YraN family protein [Candidatus Paceibacterota bacterium]